MKSTRTETGIRTIGIDQETAAVLREHRERTEELAKEFGFETLPPEGGHPPATRPVGLDLLV